MLYARGMLLFILWQFKKYDKFQSRLFENITLMFYENKLYQTISYRQTNVCKYSLEFQQDAKGNDNNLFL